MSLLTTYRSSLGRAEARALAEQKKGADLASKIVSKQAEMNRARTDAQIERSNRQLQVLLKDHAASEARLFGHQKTIADLNLKIRREEEAERKREEAARKRAQDAERRRQADTSREFSRLSERVATVEETLMQDVRAAVVEDRAEREYDVFLCHTSDDDESAGELYRELTARDLKVFFDDDHSVIRLGEPLALQLDRGIAKSRVGVVLVTEEFMKGRFWTEREFSAFISSRKRVIPVLDGVSFEELGGYSPMLAALAGLNTAYHGFDEIAGRIATNLAED